jgi:hypothetical protein
VPSATFCVQVVCSDRCCRRRPRRLASLRVTERNPLTWCPATIISVAYRDFRSPWQSSRRGMWRADSLASCCCLFVAEYGSTA